MNDSDHLHLSRAIELACASAMQAGGPFGAVIVKNGIVVAEASNQVTMLRDPTAHAEVVAIRAACAAARDHRLSGSTLYASTEPCPMCLGAAYWARLDRIVFAATRADAAHAHFDDEFLYRELAAPLADRSLPTLHLRHAQALRPFILWEQNEDRERY